MTAKLEGNELVITRVFHAPRELVFKVWSEAEHLRNWWGPKGFELSVAGLDFRPGGYFHYSMQSPDGYQMWAKFVYHEIEASERIVWVTSFSDEEGNVVRAPFSAKYPLEIRNVLTLSENNGTTTITLRGGPINATAEEQSFFTGMFESMKQGFGATFDQLEQYLAKV
ncbi:SRPBCC domain-containing protein [Paenibacillus piri]|uniref:SRPBCC domain-containing protein n=2 Tax=Paenibacillus piri TaxID=2547395 RepID=A0A4R5K7I2_9BACL|nr:SRPBCC domain-containing protein [Paenibacillus piri]